ncbi:hypothetical protein [Pectinatus frisingensis]|uniref:hypothetical protein n=1 Tax=Pectinatus frisingensis TaxID=865 RepID=UPI0018C7455C|nr:hypothetical protein [Pectinatus frisingensis]
MKLKDIFPNGMEGGIEKKIYTDVSCQLPDDNPAFGNNGDDLSERIIGRTKMHEFYNNLVDSSDVSAQMNSVPNAISTGKAALPLGHNIFATDSQADTYAVIESNGSIVLIKNKNKLRVLFDGIIQILRLEVCHKRLENAQKYYVIKITNKNGHDRLVRIPYDEYAEKGFRQINTQCPDVVFYSTEPNAIQFMNEYMARILSMITTINVQHVFMYSGWEQLNGTWQYLNGAMPNVKSARTLVARDNMNTDYIEKFFQLSKNILCTGQEKESLIIFLCSHLGYLSKLLEEGGLSAHFVMFLKGKSNTGKTSLISELGGEIFYPKKNIIRLEDTPAYIERVIAEMQDTNLLIDDAHPAPTKVLEKIINENVERITRAYGDMQLRGKCRTDMDTYDKKISGAAWLTGEYLNLSSFSSALRVLEVELADIGVNKEVLSSLQQNNLIAKTYYSAYIYYLEDNFNRLVEHFQNKHNGNRQKWRSLLDGAMDRTVDIGVTLEFVIKTVSAYVNTIGVDTSRWQVESENKLASFLLKQVERNKKADPIELFKIALKELYDAGSLKLAASKQIFKDDLENIGYVDDDGRIVVVRTLIEEDINSLLRKKGIAYLKPTLKELHEKNIITTLHPIRFSTSRTDNSRPTMIEINFDMK